MENWGHPDLVKKYIDRPEDRGRRVGPTGNEGIIGWYVPPWMAEKYPDITDWKNLNKYADCSRPRSPGARASCSTATRPT